MLRPGRSEVRVRLVVTVVTVVAVCALSVPLAANASQASSSAKPWLNTHLSVAKRVSLLLARLNLTQKISLLHGVTKLPNGSLPSVYTGYVPGIPSLGIPALHLEDGPWGVGDLMSGVTTFPAGLTVAATWNPALAKQFGTAIGEEARAKGVNVLLAPTVNIDRVPVWGRAAESFGEDPLLTSDIAAADIEGIQSQGVVATVKHLAAYNQEFGRFTQSAGVSQRVLHEIYLRAFEASVEVAHVGAVMDSYNKVNGIYATENASLMKNLRTWGFTGMVMSDWFATHATAKSAKAGLDLEMPNTKFFGAALLAAVKDGQVPVATMNRMVGAVLSTMFRAHLIGTPQHGHASATVTTPAHDALTAKIAAAGTVLLKNSAGFLPLREGGISHLDARSIAVVDAGITLGDGTTLNPTDAKYPKFEGCGSALVIPSHVVSPSTGIRAAAPPGVVVTKVAGTDAASAAASAAKAEVAVVVVHDDGCEDLGTVAEKLEGSPDADRTTLSLPDKQDTLIDAVVKANPHTVVVLATQGAVTMPWLSKVSAVLETFYPGQDDGTSLAKVLFGTVDPSGKLPVTFPTSTTQGSVHTPAQFPGVDGVEHYSEGLDVGYRYDEAQHLTPLFPFGFGLSYTKFSLGHASVTAQSARPKPGGYTAAAAVDVKVRNTGLVAGSEVAQVYVEYPRSADEPPRQLAGFARVTLRPGASKTAHVTVEANNLSVWSTEQKSWKILPGTYKFFVGTSSGSMQLAGLLTVKG